MNTRLPLTALEAFEAVGVRLSFRQAANDLGVSQSALSRHVDNLEKQFQVQLFQRQGRGVNLTPTGERLLSSLTEALSVIRIALRSIEAATNNKLVVSLLPSFALGWLIPRWDQLQSEIPNLSLSLCPELRICDLTKEEADIALRYTDNLDKSLDSTKILSEEIAPVCSPLFKEKILGGVDKYKSSRLLDAGNQAEWNAFFSFLKMKKHDFSKNRTTLYDYNVVLGAALKGRGIAIGRRSMIGSYLESGKLVKLTKNWYPSPYSYYAVTLKSRRNEKNINLFIQWLVKQGAKLSNMNYDFL